MPTAAEIAEAIATDAETGIKSVTADGVTVVALTPAERADGAKEAGSDAAMSKAHRGLRITKLVQPGSV